LSIRRYDAFKSCAAYRLLNPEDVTADLRKWGIHLLFKQAVDGSIIIGDSHEYTDVAGKEEPNINVEEQVNELILNEARQILNLPDWRIRRYWNGYYAQSKTKAIFEQVIDQKIHLITGIGGKGMTTAAGFAKQSIEKIFNI
jgi:glycine/D-amino acid oxidase-like deaminating enzyme